MASKNLTSDPIGIGFAFPIRFDKGRLQLTATQRVYVTSDGGVSNENIDAREVLVATPNEQKRVVEQSLRRIVETPRGSRFMEGRYGSLVDLVPFEVNDEATQGLALFYAVDAIVAWESRVEINNAVAQVDATRPEILRGLISYRLRRSSVTGTAVAFTRSAVQ